MLEHVRNILIVTGLLVQEWLPHLLGIGPDATGLRLLVVAAIAFLVIMSSLLLEKPWSNRRLREALFQQAWYEGVWKETVGQRDRPHALGVIRFDKASRRWIYEGIGYDRALRPAATWEAQAIFFDRAGRHEWHFNGEAHLLARDPGSGKYRQASDKFRVKMVLIPQQGDHDRLVGLVIDISAATSENPRPPFWIWAERVDAAFTGGTPSVDRLRLLPPDQVASVLGTTAPVPDAVPS